MHIAVGKLNYAISCVCVYKRLKYICVRIYKRDHIRVYVIETINICLAIMRLRTEMNVSKGGTN